MACAPNKLGVFSAHFRRFDMISNRLVQPKPPVLVHFQTVATTVHRNSKLCTRATAECRLVRVYRIFTMSHYFFFQWLEKTAMPFSLFFCMIVILLLSRTEGTARGFADAFNGRIPSVGSLGIKTVLYLGDIF